MARVITIGIAGLKSETSYPMPPIEWGRAGGTVTTLAVVGNGTSTATSQAGPLATTTAGLGTGLTVSTTAGGGVVTAIGVTVGGDGYRLGDLVTVTGANGSTATTARVTGLSYTN
jgi:hypothetical protein